VPELLDDAEDVVPAAGVEAGRVVAQLVEDLLHLEGGEDRLDEDRRLDRARRQVETLLREVEDVVPEAGLEVALELGQVEVRAAALVEQALPVVEEVEPEVEEAAGDRLAVDEHVPLGEVPAARAHEQHRRVVSEAIGLLPGVELDRALDRVRQVRLALDAVAPGRRVGVLEVGHEAARARVERVDDHLAVDRPGDLHAPVLQVGRHGRHAPVALAHLARLGKEVGELAVVQPRLALRAGGEESVPRAVEASVQLGDECQRVGAQDLLVTPLAGCHKLDPAHDFRSGHDRPSRGRGRVRTTRGTCTRPVRPSSGRRPTHPHEQARELPARPVPPSGWSLSASASRLTVRPNLGIHQIVSFDA
jgi:hypothetical protein